MIEKVAASEATILIYGESGTGKELVAQAIHQNSPRRQKPFVTLNCAALSEGILESELFGHEKGSFTGALASRKGRFEYADGGTLFLDEVADMPLSTQVKLLRVLEYGEVFRVGSNEAVKVDVRLVAATNTDLERAVNEGRFRNDLFYRLNVIPVRLPPLRQRADDVPMLVEHFLERFRGSNGPKHVARCALDALMRYDWPGNVRELENLIERAVILSESDTISLEDLPEAVLQGPGRRGTFTIDTPTMTLEELEREYILKVLHHTQWQKKRASEILGINASTLYRKLLSYGITDGPVEKGEEKGEEQAA